MLLPIHVWAEDSLLDQANAAYDRGAYAQAAELSARYLASEPPESAALEARSLMAFANWAKGGSGTAFGKTLHQLDRDIQAFHGPDSLEQLSVLSILSAVHYDLGRRDLSRQADVQIIRIARARPDAAEDLLNALRNLAIDTAASEPPEVSARFAALFAVFAAELEGPTSPTAMEATAMLALELLRDEAPARAFQRFFSHEMEAWQEFWHSGDNTAALMEELSAALNAVDMADEAQWTADVQAEFDRVATLAEVSAEIDQLLGGQDFAAVLPRMEDYLSLAPPEDMLAATYFGQILNHHLQNGDFDRARPFLTGLLSYPASYAAALDLPVPLVALVAARAGGVEEPLLEALLIRGIEVEDMLDDPDPRRRFDLMFFLGETRARNGALEQAVATFSDLLEAVENSTFEDPAFLNKTLYSLAINLSTLERHEQARPFAHRLIQSADAVGEIDALGSGLGLLSRIDLALGHKQTALENARRRIALESGRDVPVAEALVIAQVNLALLLFTPGEPVSAELIRLMPAMMQAGDVPPTLDAARTELVSMMVGGIGESAEDLTANPAFAALRAEQQADITASLATLAFEVGDHARARGLVELGLRHAPEPSEAFFRLKQVQGQVAQAEGRRGDALLAFRALTGLRTRPGLREQPGALEHLPLHLSAAYDLASDPETGADLRFHNEMFQIAQLASATTAGSALNDAIARGQSDDKTRALLRERQELARSLTALDQARARASYDGKSPDQIISRAEKARARHAELSREIAKAAPQLASMSAFDPLRMERVAPELRPDELLILFVTGDVTATNGGAASFVVALSREEVFVDALPPRPALVTLARALRCSAALTDPNCASGSGAGTRGSFPKRDGQKSAGPVFDTALAHQAFDTLIAPLGAMLKGKRRLIIVPDRTLVSLPFHLMLQEPLAPGRPMSAGNWLIRDHAIEVVPSVSSLMAMRAAPAKPERATRFLGVGDPLIGRQKAGPVPLDCAAPATTPSLSNLLQVAALKRGSGAARMRAVSDLAALPDTRCELRDIAARFGDQSRLLLHQDANEAALKMLSEKGGLRTYSVISFATHGLIAGEIGINDSGLVLSPPPLPTARDDGLLTTAEIAALDLDADFVILSACNTASGDTRNKEALSGLASAFFFAGARSLMVSHWPVYSDAAVMLTTRSFQALDANPGMDRAEALRLAMLSVVDDPAASPRQAHPAFWGPFMIVGGGR